MSVTEYVGVVMHPLFKFSAVDKQELVFLSCEPLLAFGVRDPAVARPGMRYAYPQVGMDAGKQPLTNPAVEKAFDDLGWFVARPETIAMTDKQALIANLHNLRLAIDGNAKFMREIVEHPHVVVACEERNGKTLVPQLGKLSLKSYKAFGNSAAVFKPEVEDITEQENCVRVVTNRIQPCCYPALSFEAGCGIGCTQMEIRREVNLFSVRQSLDRCKHGSR